MLYKFRSFKNNRIQILTNLELYCSLPEKLNDPLDCKFDSISIGDESKKRLTPEIFSLISNLKYQDKETKQVLNIFEAIENFIKKSGILSFSLTNEDPLIWSHYADGHRGFCIGFDLSYFEGIISRSWEALSIIGGAPVDYLPTPQYLNIITDFANGLDSRSKPNLQDFIKRVVVSIFSTKSTKWSYEKEYRIVRNSNGPINFEPKAIKEIILGSKVSERDEKMLDKILAHRDLSHIEKKRADFVPNSFSMRIKKE